MWRCFRPTVICAIVAFLAASLHTAAAQQADPGQAVHWPACEQTAMKTIDMNACAGAHERQANDRMQKAYNAVACQLDPDRLAKLAAAQQAWSVYRDAHCRFGSNWDADPRGSLSTMTLLDCRARLADTRADELDRWPYSGPSRTPCP